MPFVDVDDAQFQAFVSRASSKAKGKAILKEVGSQIEKMATKLTADVKGDTPVDTGRLRAGWETTGLGGGAGGFTFTILNNVEYAIYVENGHRTRGGGGYVPGRFMLKKNVDALSAGFGTQWQPALDRALEGLFD